MSQVEETHEDERGFGDWLSDDVKRHLAALICSPTPSRGLIYYIACPETQRIKIGYTASDPIKRLRALQTGSPTRLSLMAVHAGSLEDERFLHEQFRDASVHGEWFDTDETIFECVSYVCWATALVSLNYNREVPRWAQTGLDAIEEWLGEPLPLPVVTGRTLQ